MRSRRALASLMLDVKAPAAMKGMKFRMQVDVLDCLGCGNCADVCPGFEGQQGFVYGSAGRPVG